MTMHHGFQIAFWTRTNLNFKFSRRHGSTSLPISDQTCRTITYHEFQIDRLICMFRVLRNVNRNNSWECHSLIGTKDLRRVFLLRIFLFPVFHLDDANPKLVLAMLGWTEVLAWISSQLKESLSAFAFDIYLGRTNIDSVQFVWLVNIRVTGFDIRSSNKRVLLVCEFGKIVFNFKLIWII